MTFKTALQKAIRAIDKWPDRSAHIFHHNDADGLSSGALLSRAFSRQGFEVRRTCLEKPYPAVLQRIFSQKDRLLVFADFAGHIAPLLSELNQKNNLVVILDHHPARASTDPMVHNLDPDLFGLKGDRDISASTTCYRFACEWSHENRDLAHLAVIGAVGDGFYVDGRLAGENRKAAEEAAEQGMLAFRSQRDGENYIRTGGKLEIPYSQLAEMLDILGAVGYYQGGPEAGVGALLRGFSHQIHGRIENLKAVKRAAFESEIARLKSGGLHKTDHLQWFHVHDRFAPMGVKMIGVFCQTIRDRAFIDADKYIVGFQDLPDQIPGFGSFEFNEIKISVRVPSSLEKKIVAGRTPGADTFLPQATNQLGGFSDACHSLAAATILPRGLEEQLVHEMEKLLI